MLSRDLFREVRPAFLRLHLDAADELLEVRSFTQLAPPTEKVVLPEAVAKVAQILRYDIARSRRLPPP
jgi:hypothetical protein